MKNLPRVISSSLYNPDFYQSVRTKTVREGAKTLAYLGLLGTGVAAIIMQLFIIPFALSNVLDTVEQTMPNDLVVTVAGGQVAINQPEPYYIKNTLFEGGPKNLVIFDTADTLGVDLKQNDSLIIIKKSYVISGASQEQRVTQIDNTQPTTTLQKSDLVSLIEKVRPYFAPVVITGGIVIGLLFVLLGTFLWVVFHMVYLLFPAVLVYLLRYTGNAKLTFEESYLVALFASIPVAILSYILSFGGLQLPPFGYSLFVLVIVVVNVSRHKHTELETPKE